MVGRHVLKNAVNPIVTVLGIQVGYLAGRRHPDRDGVLLAGPRLHDGAGHPGPRLSARAGRRAPHRHHLRGRQSRSSICSTRCSTRASATSDVAGTGHRARDDTHRGCRRRGRPPRHHFRARRRGPDVPAQPRRHVRPGPGGGADRVRRAGAAADAARSQRHRHRAAPRPAAQPRASPRHGRVRSRPAEPPAATARASRSSWGWRRRRWPRSPARCAGCWRDSSARWVDQRDHALDRHADGVSRTSCSPSPSSRRWAGARQRHDRGGRRQHPVLRAHRPRHRAGGEADGVRARRRARSACRSFGSR